MGEPSGSAFEASRMILQAPVMMGRFDSVVMPERGAIRWDRVQEVADEWLLSSGEQMLVEVAWQMWSGGRGALLIPGSGPTLAELYAVLDRENMALVVRALEERLGRRFSAGEVVA